MLTMKHQRNPGEVRVSSKLDFHAAQQHHTGLTRVHMLA
jgi:hypothetical protein